MKLEFDREAFLAYEKELTDLNNDHVGVKCAHAQFTILENWRQQIEYVETLKEELADLREELKALKDAKEMRNGDDR